MHVKITALTVLALAVAAGLVFGDLTVPLKIALCVLAAVGAIVILRLKTIRDEPRA